MKLEKELKEKKNTDKIKKQTQGPQSLFQLLVLIVKGLFNNLPRKLIYFAVIALVSFLIHTYLVVFPNGGFAMGTNKVFDKTLALVGNETRGTVFWTIAAYLVTSIIRRMISIGPGKFIGGIFTGPVRLVKSIFSKKGRFISVFALCTLLFLLFGQILIKNTAIAYTLVIGAVLAIISFKFDISYLVIKLGYQDFAKLFKRKNAEFNDIYFDAFQLAVIGSMIIYSVLNQKPLYIYLICGFMVAMYILAKFKKTNKVAAQLFIFGLAGLNIAFIYMLKAYADDGGEAEVGGIENWIGSPGSGTAAAIGILPSIGAGIGGLIGIVTGEISSMANYVGDVAGEYIDDLADDAVEFVDDFVETSEDLIDEAGDYVDDLIEEGEDFIDRGVDAAEALGEDLSEMAEDAGEFIGEGAVLAGQFLDLGEDMYDVLFDSDLESKYDSLISFVDKLDPFFDNITEGHEAILDSKYMDYIIDFYDNSGIDWLAEGAVDTFNEAKGSAGNFVELFNNVKGLEKIKDLTSYLSSLNNKHITEFMDKAGGILKFDMEKYLPKGSIASTGWKNLGVFIDALDNIGKGDNVAYAGVKSFLSNAVKDAAFGKNGNPQLAIMDALVSIFTGGTEGGKIISPGKTIQGGANFIIDKFTDLYNGTDDVSKRLQSGDYGGLWKVADDTTKLAAEAVFNTSEFANDLANVIMDDEFYNDMYETNRQLWKPAEGSWAIKKAGCYVAEKAFESILSHADNVHKITKWFANLF